MINQQGEKIKMLGFEPTYEFLIKKIEKKEICTADILYSYKLKSEDY